MQMYIFFKFTLLIVALRSSSVDGVCIQSYEELQVSLFARQQNTDNLRRAFFPTNQEPTISIELHYYFHGNWTLQYPLVFRWSTSRSLGFIRPELMQGLTLHIFNRITPVVEIIVDPICDDSSLQSTLSNWEGICMNENVAPLTLQLLNELTANMKLEYLKKDRNIVINPETYRGFSSYLFMQNRTRDDCVIGQDNFYKSIGITMFISLIIVTVITFIMLPIPMMDFCKQVHEPYQLNSKSDSLYVMRAAVIESFLLWLFFICYCTHGIIKRAPEAYTEATKKMYYSAFAFLAFNYPIAIFCYIIWMSKKRGLKDRLITSGCGSSTISLIYYCSRFTAITCVAQFLIFHSVYIAIATTVVSLLQIVSFIIFFVGIVTSILLGTTYTLKTLDKRIWACSFQKFVMYFLLNVVLFWNFVTFMYINEHGNFPMITQSFSVLSIAGFIAKDTIKQIIKYLVRKN